MAPRGWVTEVTWLSPRTTSVLVTTNPTLPPMPVFPISRPLRAGLLGTVSGVSPNGTCHWRSPLSRLIAEITPYGGLTSDRPLTCNPKPPPPAAGGVGAPGVDELPTPATALRGVVRCGASAALPKPGPSETRNC